MKKMLQSLRHKILSGAKCNPKGNHSCPKFCALRRSFHCNLWNNQVEGRKDTTCYFPNLKQYLIGDHGSHAKIIQWLQQIDFKNACEYERPTFHEYNNNGKKLKVSRRVDPSVRSSAVMALFFLKGERQQVHVILLQKTPARKNTNYQHAGR